MRHHADSMVTGAWIPKPADEQGGQGQSKQQLLEAVKAAFDDFRASLAKLSEKDFQNRPDKFEANGRLIMAGTPEEMAVWNVLRHMANHTMQLLWYVKAQGIDADTGTLYFGVPPGQLSTRPSRPKEQAAG